MALEPIRVLEFADADRADVQRRVVDAVQAAPERFLTDYAARPGTFGGRYVCADAMKELLPEYTRTGFCTMPRPFWRPNNTGA